MRTGRWWFNGLITATQWISGESNQTSALWRMIYDTTFGVRGTNARTGIFAFIVETGTMTWTVVICDAFGTTTAVWISVVVGQACTCTGTVSFSADGICTAWRRMAGLTDLILGRRFYYWLTEIEDFLQFDFGFDKKHIKWGCLLVNRVRVLVICSTSINIFLGFSFR